MPQALTPVNIAGTEFDALITLDETAEADVPEYPIETGYTVSDTIIRKSKLLAMSLFVSGMPVTWRGRLGGGSSRIASVKKQLLQLYADGNPITVNTSDNTYENMAFTSISFHKATDIGFALQIDVEMKEVIVTSTATTTIPDSYGKSGTTGASAGSASTTTSDGSSGTAGGGSGTAGGGSGSGAGSGNGDGESILHGIVSSAKSGSGLFGAISGGS